MTQGPKRFHCRRSQAPLPLEDRPGKGEGTMEVSNRDVYSAGHTTAQKHETVRSEDGMCCGVSIVG